MRLCTMRFHSTAAAVSAAAAVAVCTPEEKPSVSALVLEPAAAIDAPLNFSSDVALVTNDIACVVDAYEFQIRLSHSRWRDGRSLRQEG